MSAMERLANWYRLQCDGDWEHGEGIRISTLDNPGWAVDIPLEGTDLEDKSYDPTKIERSEHDWLHCFVKDGRFRIRCSLFNLEEGVNCFLSWADPDGSTLGLRNDAG